jgi:hypothetical protein
MSATAVSEAAADSGSDDGPQAAAPAATAQLQPKDSDVLLQLLQDLQLDASAEEPPATAAGGTSAMATANGNTLAAQWSVVSKAAADSNAQRLRSAGNAEADELLLCPLTQVLFSLCWNIFVGSTPQGAVDPRLACCKRLVLLLMVTAK